MGVQIVFYTNSLCLVQPVAEARAHACLKNGEKMNKKQSKIENKAKKQKENKG